MSSEKWRKRIGRGEFGVEPCSHILLGSLSRLEHWRRNGYSSLNVSLDSDSSEGEEEGVEPEAVDIRYLVGDVTHPQNTEKSDVIVVHCVGEWEEGAWHDYSGALGMGGGGVAYGGYSG